MNRPDFVEHRQIIIDFKIKDTWGNEYWHETFFDDVEVTLDASVRDMQEHAIMQYLWDLKKECVKEMHTK